MHRQGMRSGCQGINVALSLELSIRAYNDRILQCTELQQYGTVRPYGHTVSQEKVVLQYIEIRFQQKYTVIIEELCIIQLPLQIG